MKPFLGRKMAAAVQDNVGEMRMSLVRLWDEAMFKLERREPSH
jgi:hypothetical protein